MCVTRCMCVCVHVCDRNRKGETKGKGRENEVVEKVNCFVFLIHLH